MATPMTLEEQIANIKVEIGKIKDKIAEYEVKAQDATDREEKRSYLRLLAGLQDEKAGLQDEKVLLMKQLPQRDAAQAPATAVGFTVRAEVQLEDGSPSFRQQIHFYLRNNQLHPLGKCVRDGNNVDIVFYMQSLERASYLQRVLTEVIDSFGGNIMNAAAAKEQLATMHRENLPKPLPSCWQYNPGPGSPVLAKMQLPNEAQQKQIQSRLPKRTKSKRKANAIPEDLFSSTKRTKSETSDTQSAHITFNKGFKKAQEWILMAGLGYSEKEARARIEKLKAARLDLEEKDHRFFDELMFCWAYEIQKPEHEGHQYLLRLVPRMSPLYTGDVSKLTIPSMVRVFITDVDMWRQSLVLRRHLTWVRAGVWNHAAFVAEWYSENLRSFDWKLLEDQ